MKLTPEWYQRQDVVQLSKELLGKVLCTNISGEYTSGIIVETEAYAGVSDKASHAYGGRRTKRTEVMYAQGGVAYVYLCYGIHNLFNIITNEKDVPHAVLIRGIEPLEGKEIIVQRRKVKTMKNIGIGPGKVSQALGIDMLHNQMDLQSQELWVEDRGIKIPERAILSGPRIGIDYAGEDAKLPYRFWVKNIADFL
ncbi:MAG: DNA-3-methyladenine glycosylase [Flavobacteriales bacterium]